MRGRRAGAAALGRPARHDVLGRRQVLRPSHDLHILDYWYRDPSGFGGGIEDIALGEQVKFAFSWIGGSQDQLDSNGTVPQNELYRFNKLALQYGTGAAYDFRSILGPPVGRTFVPGEFVDPDDLWQFRLVNDLLVEQRGRWQLQGAVIYQELDNGAAANNRVRWVSLGARPVYALGRFFSLATGSWLGLHEAVRSA